MNKTKFGLNATHLRIFALTLMLLDHLWATVVPGNNWMTYLGRMAFPIFAFQTAQGYIHTRDFKAYCKRLVIFALISEIPFNLMLMSSPIFPFHQNVMLTLLLGLLNDMVDAGNTVIVIEHNLDVIRQADWVIDMGPEGGKCGGQVLYEGVPSGLLQCEASQTGKCLRTEE